jgi:hypothetical protein
LKGLSWGYQVDSPYSEWADFSLFGDAKKLRKEILGFCPILSFGTVLTLFPWVYGI